MGEKPLKKAQLHVSSLLSPGLDQPVPTAESCSRRHNLPRRGTSVACQWFCSVNKIPQLKSVFI